MKPSEKILFGGALIIGLVIGGGLLLWSSDEPSPTTFAQVAPSMIYADPLDQKLVMRGKTVYAENCASCHGVDLQGEPNWKTSLPTGGYPAPPHDETGHTWHHPDMLLFAITKNGGQAMAREGMVSNMPAFGEILSDEEILATLAYIKSQWPATIRIQQEQLNQRMQQRLRQQE